MSMSFFKSNPTIFRQGFIIVCLVILAISLLLAAPAAALPPRPNVGGNSTTGSGGGGGGGDSSTNGAHIELHIRPRQLDLWTVVQWQDNTGEWFDVYGWQAPFEGESLIWWVAPSNFGQGPFRWVVYKNSNKTELLGSQEFYLPQQVGESLKVDLILQPLATATAAGEITKVAVANPQSTSPSSSPGGDVSSPSPTFPSTSTPTSLPTATPTSSPTSTPTSTSTPPPTTTPTSSPTSTPPPTAMPTLPPLPTWTPTIPTPTPLTPSATTISMSSPGVPLVYTLAFTQEVSEMQVESGQEITWTLTLTNPTEVEAKEVVLSNIPPSGLIYLGGSVSQGSIHTIGEPPIVVANLGNIASGGRVKVLIRTLVPEDAASEQVYTNFATYNAQNFTAGVSNGVSITVQSALDFNLPISTAILDPQTVSGKGIWGAITLLGSGIMLGGYRLLKDVSRKNGKKEERN